MIANRTLSGGSHLLRVEDEGAPHGAPHTAFATRPGQFAMLLAAGSPHLLRRPMSVHDAGDGWRSFMVKPVGPASRELAGLRAGERVDVSPSLGNGFRLPEDPHTRLLLVGGGFGIAPMHFVARRLDALSEPRPHYTILYGGRTARDVEIEVLDGVRGPVRTSTDDGSAGVQGTCVDLARAALDEAPAARTVVLACGSHAMMRALYRALGDRVAEIQVSLEEVMACGVGVCMGCVTRTAEGYVPICTHGPVFDAARVFADDREEAHAGT